MQTVLYKFIDVTLTQKFVLFKFPLDILIIWAVQRERATFVGARPGFRQIIQIVF